MPKIAPKQKGEFRIWIHAVSLGETKAVIPLMKMLEAKGTIFFSSTTETGQMEGRKECKYCFFLPLDFSWVMKRLVKAVQPDLFILVETDFWYNLLTELNKSGAKIALVNGKVSKTSYNRFKKNPWFAKALFAPIDLFSLQSDTDQKRFLNLGVPKEKLHVTGNLKFDSPITFSTIQGLHFPNGNRIVTVALTHNNEEELILNELQKIQNLFILLAPRHPERFNTVAKLLKKKNIPFRTLLEKGPETLILVNQMGIMDNCYAHSKVAILGGSFVSHVGGHNIYEPARHGIPVLYGPFMYNQESLMNSLKKYPIGQEVSLSNLASTLEALLAYPNTLSIKTLKSEVEGATSRSLSLLDLLRTQSDRK